MGFERILALTDLSENSTAGLALAESLARREHCRIVAGYVHTRSDLLRPFSRNQEDATKLARWVREEDEEHLASLCAKHIDPLRLEGIETLDADNARDGVLDLIQRVKPDLVCMATRGRTGVSHLLLGSIAEHTLRGAGVPVCVTRGSAPPPVGEPIRVLLGHDLIEDPTPLTVRVAAAFGEEDEIILAHVVESWFYSPSAYGSEFALPQPDVPALVEAATERLRIVSLPPGSPKLSIQVTTGRPGEGMLMLEKDCKPNLVAAQTHGRRGFDRMMLGSVSEFLARKCTSPVLVYPKA